MTRLRKKPALSDNIIAMDIQKSKKMTHWPEEPSSDMGALLTQGI